MSVAASHGTHTATPRVRGDNCLVAAAGHNDIIANPLRPWLTSLLAISANSPIYGGRDTGWASWRYRIVARWPTARLPAVWPDAAAYDATVRHLIRDRAAFDESSVYFHARLSPHYPTVEIRVADVCPDIDMTLLVAALARALVTTPLEEINNRAPLPKVSPQALLPGLYGVKD